ncbi:VOC family protein [Acidiferrimicrobium sp. IK]|uniref:VOC family protein n=1 Tax=Acidiferrimicrobium sp. IK TaxID=2871700 RepID=UPI0021CB4E1F|nr:VOC family protein [Acidiferrimicrobium sp. IK]MCU4182849.1 VOC family protein [Acidiferrimicrobium sp. IK]
MTGAVSPLHMNHINLVAEDLSASNGQLMDLLGARLNTNLPSEEWLASLVTIGGTLFEVFAPRHFLLNARYGPHYVGIEFEVPDIDHARRAARAQGLRVIRELGVAFHVHPGEAFGIAFEFYEGNFHSSPNPTWMEQLKAPAHFAAHPIGYVGLKRWSVAVGDLAAAAAFFRDFLGAEPAYQAQRAGPGASVVGLHLGGTVVELLAPTGPGRIGDHLARYGDGIRSTVFQVRDLDDARRYFQTRGVGTEAGDDEDAFALPIGATRGVRFEFSE